MPPEMGPWLAALRGTRTGWAGPAAALWALASGLALLDRAMADAREGLAPHELNARREPVQAALRQAEALWPWAEALMAADGPAKPALVRVGRRLVDLAVEALMGIKANLDAVPPHALGEVEQAWRLLVAAGEGGLALWEAHARDQDHELAMAERAAIEGSARLMHDYAALAAAECAWRLRRR